MTNFFAAYGLERSDIPQAVKKPQERTHHGDSFIDNYEWLRAKRQR